MKSASEIFGAPGEGELLTAAPEASAPSLRDGTCLNCGTALFGPHCHACGQAAHIHRTASAILHDLAHGALHFEGRVWHTLPELVLRPGQLTRRYIDGERTRFVSPMALFLFSIFLMFATFQILGFTTPTDVQPILAPAQDAQIGAAIEALPADNPARESAENQLTLSEIRTGWPLIDKGIEKWEKNPSLMLYKLQANSYKFSWLLIPLSLPFVWLLFAWRRRFGAYDHAVFVTYSLSFVTLLYLALALAGQIGTNEGAILLAATLVPLVHMYRQLKGAYGLSRASALWRTAALSGFILVILFLFVDALLLLGTMG